MEASRICSACAVSMMSDDVSPKWSHRADGPTRSATAVVKAPMAGRFYVEHPGSATPQKLPRSGSDADVVGFVGVGHVLLPLRASRSGVLIRLLAEPGALVGFGDPLFEIELQP